MQDSYYPDISFKFTIENYMRNVWNTEKAFFNFISTLSDIRIVANCHKIPQKQFLKELLSIDEIRQSLEAIMALVKSMNPKMRCIVTVSPVRHLKDGFEENTRSKAHLVAAVHEVVNFNKDFFYFPAYELLLDELRDYRFFKADMMHP